MTIGDVARRAGVATSTVRYYERLGLVAADARESGQRRFRAASLRRLAFIGLCKDAGLSLDDIAGMLRADKERWRSIARARLAALDEEIARLERAREHLGGALSCPHEHPFTECGFLAGEIDRRLAGAT